jgi:site-specific recombinase XerD
MDDDWVFASPAKKGKQPYWPDNLMKRYVKPIALKAGINKNIGWHTFCHSFGKVVEMMVPNLGETRGKSHPRSA